MKQLDHLAIIAAALAAPATALAGNEAVPLGDPVLERPTLRSLGAYWIIRGDDNKNATIRVDYRKSGDTDWHQGPSFFRVEKGAHKTKEHGTLLNVPDDAWLMAGSIVTLDPDTKYDLRLTLTDPDGGFEKVYTEWALPADLYVESSKTVQFGPHIGALLWIADEIATP